MWRQVPNWSRDDLQDILSDALSQAWTPAQEAVLNNEAGMETVIDAVVRVTKQVLLLTLLATALHVVGECTLSILRSFRGQLGQSITLLSLSDASWEVGQPASCNKIPCISYIMHTIVNPLELPVPCLAPDVDAIFYAKQLCCTTYLICVQQHYPSLPRHVMLRLPKPPPHASFTAPTP